MNAAPDTAGVRVRPPLLMLGAVLAGLALDRLAPWPLAPGLDARWRLAFGGLLFLAGAALLAACLRRFARAGTNVRCSLPVRALVTDGPYGWSRNPIYLALTALGAGLAIAAGSAWPLPLLAAALVVLRYAVIAREEALLERKFGTAWRDYRARVRRWL